MNAERLLAHYAEIAEAPDAIERLRHFILDLAVRGKLVPQAPTDEPAADLLRRVAAEKSALARMGKIRPPKALPPVDEPFDLPSGWRWSQLAEIGVLSPRNDAPDDLRASFVPMPLIAAEYGVPNGHDERAWGEIKKGYTHFAEGDVGLAKITPCFENGKSTVFRNLTGGLGSGTTELHIIRPIHVDPDYILIFLKCPYFIETGIPLMTGTAGQKRVSSEYFAHSPFPLPPLAEQHRIVAKVDELMALCDVLEAARTAREAARDRLAAASLARLNTPNPETFQADARFALDALPAITARPDQIKQLRQTILNLAVLGRLVPQDAKEEPASKLLVRIALTKERLLSEGSGRGERATHRTSSRVVTDTPSGWIWTNLQSICLSVTDGDHQAPPRADAGVPFLVIGDVRSGAINYNAGRWVPRAYYDGLDATRRPRSGDLLYTLVGSFGIPVRVLEDRAFCVQRHIGILRPSTEISAEFLARVLESRLVFDQAEACATGIAQKTVPLSGLRAISVPLPPRPEQDRITARIRELLALCDELEATLTAADSTRRRLLESLLAEALGPAARDLEAA